MTNGEFWWFIGGALSMFVAMSIFLWMVGNTK